MLARCAKRYVTYLIKSEAMLNEGHAIGAVPKSEGAAIGCALVNVTTRSDL